MVYRNFSSYLREKYGTRLGKICLDGGFTCPNRDGKCGTGGCIYCGERGAGEHIATSGDIAAQTKRALENAKPDEKFIAYFQNFTGTYAPTEKLRELYDAAVTDERVVALAIATRPDCVTEENAELIASYAQDREVWVELGFQTSDDETAKRINRGYPSEVLKRAVAILAAREIPVVLHLMVGLPGENLSHVKRTVDYIADLPLWGIKIHSIYVMRNTALAALYESGAYCPPTREEYVEAAVWILTHISPEIIVHRLTGDCPRGMLVAPEWNADKNATIRAIVEKMEKDDLTQGCFYRQSGTDNRGF